MTTKSKFLAISAATFASLTLLAQAAGAWLEDIPSALKKASKSNLPVLVEFTGSDWCPPCKMMDKQVFSKKEFLKGAQKNYILVKIDIPQSDRKLAEKNNKVMEAYKVSSVPTVLLLKPDGSEFERFSATTYSSVSLFLKHINAQAKRQKMH